MDLPSVLVERIGAYLQLWDRRACTLAHRDLAAVMHADTQGAWSLRPDVDYSVKGAALLRLKPRLKTLTLTLDGLSYDFVDAMESIAAFAHAAGLIRLSIVEEGHPDGGARLLQVLAALQAVRSIVRVDRAEGLRLPQALLVLEAIDSVGDLRVDDWQLTADELALWQRIVGAGVAADSVRFCDENHGSFTGRDAEKRRLLRASARLLDVRSGAACSPLARVADNVSYDIRLVDDRLSREMLENVAANSRLKSLAIGSIDVAEAILCTQLLDVLAAKGPEFKVYLHGRAADSLELPTLVAALLTNTPCQVRPVVKTLAQRVVASRAVRAVAKLLATKMPNSGSVLGESAASGGLGNTTRVLVIDVGSDDPSAIAAAAEAVLAISTEPVLVRLRTYLVMLSPRRNPPA